MKVAPGMLPASSGTSPPSPTGPEPELDPDPELPPELEPELPPELEPEPLPEPDPEPPPGPEPDPELVPWPPEPVPDDPPELEPEDDPELLVPPESEPAQPEGANIPVTVATTIVEKAVIHRGCIRILRSQSSGSTLRGGSQDCVAAVARQRLSQGAYRSESVRLRRAFRVSLGTRRGLGRNRWPPWIPNVPSPKRALRGQRNGVSPAGSAIPAGA